MGDPSFSAFRAGLFSCTTRSTAGATFQFVGKPVQLAAADMHR